MIKYLLLITILFTQPYSGDYGTPKEKQFLCNTLEEMCSIIAEEKWKLDLRLDLGWELKYRIYKLDLENNCIEDVDGIEIVTECMTDI